MLKNLRFFLLNAICSAVLILFMSFVAFGQDGKVTVSWDPIEDPDVGGYTVVWGTASKTYAGSQNAGVSPTESTILLPGGKTYYFAVRGFDKAGVPGELSDEVSAIVRGSDTTPPVISGISINNITASAATISFNTNEEAYVQVEYGLSSALENYTGLTNVSFKTHQVVLSGLSSATTYFFRITAKDLSGNQGLSGISSFKTESGKTEPPDPNAPIKFIQITLSNVSSNSVTVNWVRRH